ncbi:EI24 domain-containing protein [Piscinibacter sp. XHJ-5]|uniref:EI24 domain-containing protein n=1 Tax=Piscinibacter sp. XHJ-5 TaxID=3037797 RepID=UPI00245365C7|nr:EI24 domain-containing protein [Piscinibacter sp. XHJ-5]
MNLLFDSFWRAAAYCLHPRVILLSLAPLLLMAAMALALGYFFWEPALDAVSAAIASWELMSTFVDWLDSVGLAGLKAALAPLVVVFVTTPMIVVVSLLVVAALMAPAIVKLVADRRFPSLHRAHGGSLVGGTVAALGATLVALLALVLSIPLWLVPPLVLIVPPLIWGWLTYRVMSYDVLAEHASREERQQVIRRHRHSLFAIGVISGYLGAAPSLVWVSGAMVVVLAPVLVPLAIWIYMLVFAFSALWFAHYALAALQALRAERRIVDAAMPHRRDVPPALPPATEAP